MKKSVLKLLLSLCMVVILVASCGSNENGDVENEIVGNLVEKDKKAVVKTEEMIIYYEDGSYQKTINEYDIYGNEVGQKGWENGVLNHGYEFEYEYDENGNILVGEFFEYSFKENGDFEKVFKFLQRCEYDEAGNRVLYKQYDENEVVLYEREYENEYDSLGNLVKTKEYEEGKLIREVINIYEDGQRIRYKWEEYDENGICTSCVEEEYEYDENGNKVHEKSYVDGKLDDLERGYIYDEYGNVLKLIGYIDGKQSGEILYVYEYDAKGNPLKCTYELSEGLKIEVIYTYYE